jgi:murein DD-endopeptidase MepM/ murein hydrolase activator NlpD
MRIPKRFTWWLGLLSLVFCAACSPAAASTFFATGSPAKTSAVEAQPALTPTQDCFCAVISPSDTPTPIASQPASVATPAIVTPAAPTLVPLSITPFPSLASCNSDVCTYPGVFPLVRPIASPGNDKIDPTYRFGSTAGRTRDPHHGVELLNGSGTPVLAAADGVVVVAGDDRKVFYGPYSYFYGNLVVIQHSIQGLAQPLYTLYGHLSQIKVQVGDRVQAGQLIGLVGMTGIATGSHLHFEVRLGENSYKSSRNPELWLAPHIGHDGQPNGALAGRILDANGKYLPVSSIVVQHLPAPGQPSDGELYLGTYEDKAMVGQTPWEENFAAGDLPPGWYRVSFAQNGVQTQEIQVLPGQLTLVTWRLGGAVNK